MTGFNHPYPYPDGVLSKYLTTDCVYLFDPTGVVEPMDTPSFTINASSLTESHYRHFIKRPDVTMMYVPCWSREEILAVAPFVPGFTTDLAKHYFDLFGGIPRSIFHIAWRDDEDFDALQCAINGIESSYLESVSLVASSLSDKRITN